MSQSKMKMKMKNLDIEKAHRILGALELTAYEDLGSAACYKGIHPLLGELVLLIKGSDGTGILIS